MGLVTFSLLGQYGRLGNQLFQVASTIGIARRNKYDFKFPVWEPADMLEGDFPQAYTLEKLPQYREGSLRYRDIDLEHDTDLVGNFQSQKYFAHCADEIRRMFALRLNYRKYLHERYDRVLSADTTCSLHVRRGDYVGSKKMICLGEQYYHEAMSCMEKGTQFLVFSDDMLWCKKHLLFGAVDPNDLHFVDEVPMLSLQLMAMCRHNIIANSSFSWWGAWLNSNNNKLVIAPESWYKDDYIARGRFRRSLELYDLIPHNWAKLPITQESTDGP